MAALLEVEGLKAYYGQTQALHDVSFALEPGGITTLLGANGAGKTTTLRSICSMVRTEGSIRFDGRPIARQGDRGHRAPRRRPRAGGPRHLHQPQRRREPARRRLHALATRPPSQRDLDMVLEYFPILKAAPRPSRPARCRAASSRCWRSAAR